uniref:Tc1-like transposase DDE domain-containing protein n=1 Tax=Labrus bergylta TaxID=56723 RepID=A0A3Q3GAI9_9LABR
MKLLLGKGSLPLLCILSCLRMEWPACCHDLNPIEHLWDQLGRAVHARVTNTTTLADLQQRLVEEWGAIPQQCVTRLVTSMMRGCQAKVEAAPLPHRCLTLRGRHKAAIIIMLGDNGQQ